MSLGCSLLVKRGAELRARRLNVHPLCVLGLIGLLAACSRQTEERVVDLVVPVTVQPVELGTIESLVSVTGTLRPAREAELITEMKGDLYLSEANGGTLLSEGHAVNKGDVVARLENKEWVVNANLESRRLTKSTTGKTLAEQEALFKRGLTTEKDVENARKSLADAEANYEGALIQIEKTRVRAPISGILSDLTDATHGTLVNQNTVIGKILDYTQVVVDLSIPNSQIQAVGLGKEVRVTNYAYAGQVFTGQVRRVDPSLDPTTRTFRVVANIDNPDLLLRPGMFVKAEIVSEAHKDVVLIRREYVVFRQNRKVVFVEVETRAEEREVEIGLENRTHAEIEEGLDEGDRLITSNYETLRPRTQVRVTGETTPSGRRGDR